MPESIGQFGDNEHLGKDAKYSKPLLFYLKKNKKKKTIMT